MLQDVERLNRYRLDNDLTYEELAQQVGVPTRTLYTALTGKSAPWDRTLHKIRRFIERLPDDESTASPARRRAAAR